MVYYIVACHRENNQEGQDMDIVKKHVMIDNGKALGELYPLVESVSFFIEKRLYFDFLLCLGK